MRGICQSLKMFGRGEIDGPIFHDVSIILLQFSSELYIIPNKKQKDQFSIRKIIQLFVTDVQSSNEMLAIFR